MKCCGYFWPGKQSETNDFVCAPYSGINVCYYSSLILQQNTRHLCAMPMPTCLFTKQQTGFFLFLSPGPLAQGGPPASVS